MFDRPEYMRRYRLDHADELRASEAAYREAHREEAHSYSAAYYQAHKEELREKDAKRQRWFTGNLNILKRAQGCDDCETHAGRLDYHHVDHASKVCNVSQMCSHSLEKFMDEIAKCVVLCCSCHKKRNDAGRTGAWAV